MSDLSRLDAAVRACVRQLYGSSQLQPIQVEVVLSSGKRLVLPLPDQPVSSSSEAGCSSARQRASHSEDYRTVVWFGRRHDFSPLQAACVRVLWEAWEDGTPGLAQETILEAAGSSGSRLRDVFRVRDEEGTGAMATHPAWGSMIGTGRKGTFLLVEPVAE